MKELKLIEGWEDNMNKRFVVMSSISNRLIYRLNDDYDEYAFLDDYIHSLLVQQQALSYQQGREESIKEVKEKLALTLNHGEDCKHPYAHCGEEFSDIRLGFDRACREVEEVINSIQ